MMRFGRLAALACLTASCGSSPEIDPVARMAQGTRSTTTPRIPSTAATTCAPGKAT